MYFLDWLKSYLRSPSFTGLIDDPRWQYEKDKDYIHEERIGTPTVNAFSNTQLTESPYPYENQNRTSSCVPHGVGLALAIERSVDLKVYQRLSWIFNYRLRSNYPAEGSWLQGQFDLYRHYGAPLFTTLPDPVTEEQANAVVLTTQMQAEADIFKGLTYYTIQKPTIDAVATVASQHGVAIIFYATQDEWGRDYPAIQQPDLNPLDAEVRHCVCVLPYSGFLLNGKKYVTVQDSAWFGAKKIRHLSEDFFNKRVFGAAYWDTVSSIGSGPRPKYHFTQILRVGSTGEDVRQMQLLLISEDLLPNDCATGYFGGRTLAGVHAFQSKYNADILVPLGLLKPTDLWGNGCINKANQLCG